MSAGGSAMIRGSAIFSNKDASADENAFTEQGDYLNCPTNYHENTETFIRLIDKGEVEEDVLDTLVWANIFKTLTRKFHPLNRQQKLPI